MLTADQARAIALSMPGAEEKSHFEHPDFRVNNKIFATLWPDGKHSVVKLGVEEQYSLVKADPATFSIPRGGQRGGWTAIDLTRVKNAQYRALIIQSWRQVAPKRLVESGKL